MSTEASVKLCRRGHPQTPENQRSDRGCRVCKQVANRERLARDPEKRKAYMQAWRAANPERVEEHARRSHANESKAKKAEWAKKNRKREAESKRRRYWANVEEQRAAARRRAAKKRLEDPLYATRKTKEWAQQNPERHREIVRLAEQRRRARKLGRSLLFSREQLEAKMAYWGNRCWMCGGDFESVDHVKPLSKGGLDALCNLRPACGSCNSRKGATWPLPDTRRAAAA